MCQEYGEAPPSCSRNPSNDRVEEYGRPQIDEIRNCSCPASSYVQLQSQYLDRCSAISPQTPTVEQLVLPNGHFRNPDRNPQHLWATWPKGKQQNNFRISAVYPHPTCRSGQTETTHRQSPQQFSCLNYLAYSCCSDLDD